jgi:UDP-N-acetylglucosamine--N-acetylmuramyl-(pentapeptide) pyrophosphoryl-undecaprenol N-acetylglucosamine transferase
MKIILAGGGTLGSVSPLIAIWQSLKKLDNNLQTFFIGSRTGQEAEFVKNYHLAYLTIFSGKFRRYFNLSAILDLFKILLAYVQSLTIIYKIKPDFIVSAGSFVAVPLIWASKFSKTKIILYQSDLQVGLANKLSKKTAFIIYTAFPETVNYLSKNKTECVGTVLREEIRQLKKTGKRPLNILVLGGGTGSQKINDLIDQAVSQLTKKYHLVHVRGKNKGAIAVKKNYESADLLTADYYQKISEADLVISRAGLSAIMELSYLAKPTILIPLPNSPQEANAQYLNEKGAALVLNQRQLSATDLIKEINLLINDQNQLNNLSANIYKIFPHQGEEKIAKKIYEFK